MSDEPMQPEQQAQKPRQGGPCEYAKLKVLVKDIVRLRRKQDGELKALLMWSELMEQLKPQGITIEMVESLSFGKCFFTLKQPQMYKAVKLKDGTVIELNPPVRASEFRELDDLLDEPDPEPDMTTEDQQAT